MTMKMLEDNYAAYGVNPSGNTFNNESMICEFRKTLYYKLKTKKGSIFLRKLSHLWLPIKILDVGARETRISFNNKLGSMTKREKKNETQI